jgi:hypothetical protein
MKCRYRLLEPKGVDAGNQACRAIAERGDDRPA